MHAALTQHCTGKLLHDVIATLSCDPLLSPCGVLPHTHLQRVPPHPRIGEEGELVEVRLKRVEAAVVDNTRVVPVHHRDLLLPKNRGDNHPQPTQVAVHVGRGVGTTHEQILQRRLTFTGVDPEVKKIVAEDAA